MARTWGFWTRTKLELLAGYLPAFTTAAKLSPVTVYLDLFSGDPENADRATGETLAGSAKRALECTPPFTKVRLFELEKQAQRLQTQFGTDYPGRDVKVYAGDCNVTIDAALDELSDVRWAPMFAFIDPYAAELRWSTLEKLAAHRRHKAGWKVELWVLFAHAQLPRGLGVRGAASAAQFMAKTSALLGCDTWEAAYRGRQERRLTGAEFRDELANLMRWRLEQDLHYRHTMALELRNTNGTPIYTMIFASDHAVGRDIMIHQHTRAAAEFSRMQAEARAQQQDQRDLAKGMIGLFDTPVSAREPDRPMFDPQPPRRPLSWAQIAERPVITAEDPFDPGDQELPVESERP